MQVGINNNDRITCRMIKAGGYSNLEYDLDEVLKPEWRRLRVAPIGAHGFCALRLAQRAIS